MTFLLANAKGQFQASNSLNLDVFYFILRNKNSRMKLDASIYIFYQEYLIFMEYFERYETCTVHIS